MDHLRRMTVELMECDWKTKEGNKNKISTKIKQQQNKSVKKDEKGISSGKFKNNYNPPHQFRFAREENFRDPFFRCYKTTTNINVEVFVEGDRGVGERHPRRNECFVKFIKLITQFKLERDALSLNSIKN